MQVTCNNANLAYVKSSDITVNVEVKGGLLANNKYSVQHQDDYDTVYRYGEVDVSEFNSGYLHCVLNKIDESATDSFIQYIGVYLVFDSSNNSIGGAVSGPRSGTLSDYYPDPVVINLSNYSGASKIALGIPNPVGAFAWSVVWKDHA